jgi:hypothetical protein
MLFAILRSRIVWVAVGVVTVAGVAFVLTVAVTAAVVVAVRGEDVDPDQVAELATSLGLLAVATTTAAMLAAWRGLRQARVRRWLLLYEAMVHDAASATETHLAQILTRPDPRGRWAHAGGGPQEWEPGPVVAARPGDAARHGRVVHPDLSRAAGAGMDEQHAMARMRARNRTREPPHHRRGGAGRT